MREGGKWKGSCVLKSGNIKIIIVDVSEEEYENVDEWKGVEIIEIKKR